MARAKKFLEGFSRGKKAVVTGRSVGRKINDYLNPPEPTDPGPSARRGPRNNYADGGKVMAAGTGKSKRGKKKAYADGGKVSKKKSAMDIAKETYGGGLGKGRRARTQSAIDAALSKK